MSLSKQMRENSLFMRNNFPVQGKWNYALFKKQNFSFNDYGYCFEQKTIDLYELNSKNVFHYFENKKERDNIYNLSKHNYKKLEKFSLIISPGCNIYNMSKWEQIVSVGKCRWCAAKLQELGFNVIISVFWGDVDTYEFAFDGIEENSIVCIDSRNIKNKQNYITGFIEMKEKIKPSKILCYGPKISELNEDIIYLKYDKEEQ